LTLGAASAEGSEVAPGAFNAIAAPELEPIIDHRFRTPRTRPAKTDFARRRSHTSLTLNHKHRCYEAALQSRKAHRLRVSLVVKAVAIPPRIPRHGAGSAAPPALPTLFPGSAPEAEANRASRSPISCTLTPARRERPELGAARACARRRTDQSKSARRATGRRHD